ncbi:hypothetical protein GCM10009555_029910 [Acrocarpospora macrocephala]|uniref:Uncharacterized protein n=1 Tax=Acrocarpospora macrocephala TaxID=150177 RepID=A0A5M3X3A3_9ACTN|nr:hypothetical protein Amac_086990 [Acrocarpospora macrocephala]
MNGVDMFTDTLPRENALLIPESTAEPNNRRKVTSDEEIAGLLTARITDGIFAKGEPIPTIHEVMRTHQVSFHTATNAQHRLPGRRRRCVAGRASRTEALPGLVTAVPPGRR